MKLIRAASATVLAVFAATSVLAQSGGLEITVVDATDNTPLPAATVILSNTQQLVDETAYTTDKNGVASFPILRAGGGYVVEVRMPGYSTVRQTDVRVRLSSTEKLTIVLGDAYVERETVRATTDVVSAAIASRCSLSSCAIFPEQISSRSASTMCGSVTTGRKPPSFNSLRSDVAARPRSIPLGVKTTRGLRQGRRA